MTSAKPFSYFRGGRVHAVLTREGVADARGRLILLGGLIGLAWLPLVVLTVLAGTFIGGVTHSLFRDVGVWIRFLVFVPILILAEPHADHMLGIIIDLFRRADIVQQPDRPAFEAAVDRARRRASSVTVALILLAVALALPHLVTPPAALTTDAAWFGTEVRSELTLSPAGRWYTLVSLPLTWFLLLQWLWRGSVWWGLAWRVSKLDLVVLAGHPDRAGGFSILALGPRAFLPVFMGMSALSAAGMSNRIQFAGWRLENLRGPIVAFVIGELLLLLAPQLFFLRALRKARYRALIGYNLAGSAMTRGFEDRWTDPSVPRGNQLLDSQHPGAMTDYASTYGLVSAMSPVGISLRELIAIALALTAPFAPLLLFRYSLREILSTLLGLLA